MNLLKNDKITDYESDIFTSFLHFKHRLIYTL